MNMISRTMMAVLLPTTLALTLSGCGTSMPNPTEKVPGFLPDYSLLKPVANAPKGSKIYNYKAPGVSRSSYHAVILEPVILYQTATANGVTDDQINSARDNIQAGIQNIVAQQMPLTNNAGPGVSRLTVAITGAVVDGQSFKVRNLIPISAAIYLASKTTNLDSKTPSMMVELKFTDSVSGQLLRETVTIINGDSFRMQSSTSGEFTQLAQQWVQDALQYSSTQSTITSGS